MPHNTKTTTITTLCIMFAVFTLRPQDTGALEPHEVLVVANSASGDSVELAEYYAKMREIPQKNIAKIKTTTRYQVSRENYETQILLELRKHMLKNDLSGKIRCVCLMWGVPVRVAGPKKAAGEIGKVFKLAAQRAKYRLAIDYKLIGTVGRKFPAPRTQGLRPIGNLFESPMPEPSKSLLDKKDPQKDITGVLARKEVDAGLIKDADHKQIAMRQLAALHMDIYGIKGAIRFLKDHEVPGAPAVDELSKRLEKVEKELAEIRKSDLTAEKAAKKLDLMEQSGGVSLIYSYAAEQASRFLPKRADAAVDSELALMWWGEYKTDGPILNPLHWKTARKYRNKKVPPVMMTARIDGPAPDVARNIINDSVAVEKTGLSGTFYIDIGGPKRAREYDSHLKKLESFVKTNTKINVVTEDTFSVFKPNTCPNAALYCGWYSLKKYVPAFTWRPGAVAWHIASFEAMNLRNPESEEWCPKMLQNGVAATIGAVNEPYLGSFPLPEHFFPLLLTGEWTVAECYWRTNPMVSWRQTLIADPLYNPFDAESQLKPDALPPGLAP